MPTPPNQRICGLIELAFNSLHNLRQAIHSSQKHRYRLLDPTAEHGVSDALDCYKFVSDNFAVAVTPNKSVLRLLKALDDEWDKLCDELIEILGANSSCDLARSAIHLAHKEFTARIIDPTIPSGDSLQYACDCLSSVAEEFKRYVITCGGDDNERRHQEQLAKAARQTELIERLTESSTILSRDALCTTVQNPTCNIDIDSVCKIITHAAETMSTIVSKIRSAEIDRYQAVDPSIPPMITAIYPFTEEFVINSATDAEWHLMKAHKSDFDVWMAKFAPLSDQFQELFKALDETFPNATECSHAERSFRTMADRIAFHGSPDYMGPRKGFTKKTLSDVHLELCSALAALSDFIKHKDKPITQSGHKRVRKGKLKPGRQHTQEQDRQISQGLRHLESNPGKWTAAARPVIEAEQTRIEKLKTKTNGFLAHAKNQDFNMAVENLSKAIKRAALAAQKEQ